MFCPFIFWFALVFRGRSYSVATPCRTAAIGPVRCAGGRWRRQPERALMSFHDVAGAVCRTLTARKDGPSLHDICDPLLLKHHGGDAHLSKFYRTALGNPPLRALLRRAGLPDLRDEARLQALRGALTHARDDAEPDWAAVGAPVAELVDTIDLAQPRPPAAQPPRATPSPAKIDGAIRTCGAHLLRSFGRNGFIPTYAAFNLIGDPDLRGREMLMALTGLNARGYKNSTLLFN